MSADSLAPLSPAVRAFAQRHGIAETGVRGGRLTLTVDKRYRVHMEDASHHRVALHATLMPMPAPGDRAGEALLHKMLAAALGMARDHASTLCTDTGRDALALQQFFPSDARPEAVEAALAEFTNALAFWKRLAADSSL